MFGRELLGGLGIAAYALLPILSAHGAVVDPKVLDACSGYSATNVKSAGATLTADLTLNGNGCGVFGADVKKLALQVIYETSEFVCL
jgi:alpha-glucosidase